MSSDLRDDDALLEDEASDSLQPLPSDTSISDLSPAQQEAIANNQQVLEQILKAKKGEPSKFQSFWEKDEEDVDLDREEQIRTVPSKRMLWAAENNMMEVAKELLEKDKSLIHSRDRDQYTPLHRACYNGHVDMVKFLLKQGADIGATTVDCWQPLHSACRWNNVNVATVLVQQGADVNAQTEGGQTPLHLAAQNSEDCKPILEMLLMNRKIKPHLKNNQGETAYDVCARSNEFLCLFEVSEPSINELKPKPAAT